GLEGHPVPERLEVGDLVRIHGQLRAPLQEVIDLGPFGRHRRALVEGDLVDAEVFLEVGEEADQRLADGPGPDDVYDLLHGSRTFHRPRRQTPLEFSPGERQENTMRGGILQWRTTS